MKSMALPLLTLALMLSWMMGYAESNGLGSIVKVHGRKVTIDGQKAKAGDVIKVGSIVVGHRGNNGAEIVIDQMRMMIYSGQLSFSKDMQKKGNIKPKKKGRKMKIQIDHGLFCLNASQSPSRTSIRFKTGPHELLVEESTEPNPFLFCLERDKDSSVLYWKSGKASWQKIKPQKIQYNLNTELTQRWGDKEKAPNNEQLATPKKTRFDEMIDLVTQKPR